MSVLGNNYFKKVQTSGLWLLYKFKLCFLFHCMPLLEAKICRSKFTSDRTKTFGQPLKTLLPCFSVFYSYY